MVRGPPESKRGYEPGKPFNVRCREARQCHVTKIEMHFLADVHVTCDVCKGALQPRDLRCCSGKSIADVPT